MWTNSQILTALKKLHLYQSSDVVRSQDGYRLTFDWCGDRVTASFDETGKLLGCVNQQGYERKVYRDFVEGALALAVRVTCLDDDDLEDGEIDNG